MKRHAVVGVAAATFAGLARHARRGEVSALEERVFRAVNALPDAAHRPLWVVMQGGSLAAVGVVSGAAALAGRREVAVRLGVAGTSVWAFCKLIKYSIGRGRPDAHLKDVIVRGDAQSGLGFPSGHTAVALTLAGVAAPSLSRPAARAALAAAGVVAFARMYVGAHLPAVIAGGVAVAVIAASCTPR
jgi:membrane-associated phospholipid phosphatase